MSLTRGLTVYLTSENGQKMTSKIERIVKDSNVEIMQTTPSVMKFHLENLNDENSLKNTIKNGIIGIYKNEILEDTDERKKNKWINSN